MLLSFKSTVKIRWFLSEGGSCNGGRCKLDFDLDGFPIDNDSARQVSCPMLTNSAHPFPNKTAFHAGKLHALEDLGYDDTGVEPFATRNVIAS